MRVVRCLGAHWKVEPVLASMFVPGYGWLNRGLLVAPNTTFAPFGAVVMRLLGGAGRDRASRRDVKVSVRYEPRGVWVADRAPYRRRSMRHRRLARHGSERKSMSAIERNAR